MDKSLFLTTALEGAKQSEKIIRQYFNTGVPVMTKTDNSPVTKADQESEQLIRKIISQTFPDHGFLGEEFGTSDHSSEYTWIIDPIDGTKNFIRNIPLFGTLIALMHAHEIIVGVLNAPMFSELTYGEKGMGTFINDKKVGVSKTKTIADAYISFGSASFGGDDIGRKLQTLAQHAYQVRAFGDCWAYSLVVGGNIDAVVEMSVKIWDVAALVPIIQEAGGNISDMAGKPIGLSTTSFVATNGLLHEEVIEQLR